MAIPLFIFIVAEDDYDRESAIVRIKRLVGQESAVIETYYRHDADIYSVLDSALNLPLFADKKIVILKYQDDFTAADAPILVEYISKASHRTTLVVIARSMKGAAGRSAESLKELKDMMKPAPLQNLARVESSAILIEIKRRGMSGRDSIVQWIQETAGTRMLKIGKDAAVMLAEMCGKDRMTIEREIEKLSGFKERERTVTIEDVKRIAAENRIFDVYSLIDSICSGERATAIATVRSLIEADVRHPFIIWHLDNFYSRAAMTKYFIRNGMAEEKAAAKAGQKFYIREFLDNIRKMDEEKLLTIPARLLEADRMMKSGVPEKLVLEHLIFELI